MTQPVYLLVGERFLADEALDKIRIEAGSDAFSETVLEATAPAAALLDALQTPSLLGGHRLVVVYEAHDLLKDQATALGSYLESPAPHSTLVLVASKRTKLDAAVRKVGTVTALEPPKGRRLASWVAGRAPTHDIRLDDRAVWELIDAVGTELRDLDTALRQLSITSHPGSRIGSADVRRLFPRAADERIYAFTDGVGDRRLAPALGALRRLLDQGEHPLVILGALASQVRRMLRARPYAERGTKAIEDVLGLPRWRAERLQRQARSYREDELVEALSRLAETDIELKSGGHDVLAAAALERAVVEIVTG